MTAAEFAQQLGEMAKRLPEIGQQAVETKAIVGTTLIVERIQSKGMGKYSTKRLPDWYFSDKEINAGGRAYLLKKEKEKDKAQQGVTWGEFRAAQGLQNSFVDYTYTGRTLGGIIIVEFSRTEKSYTASTGGSDSEVDDKLKWGDARYPGHFQPTPAEQAETDEAALDVLENWIKQLTGETPQ